jgi:predicted tellurium resistance membrane protein TerC
MTIIEHPEVLSFLILIIVIIGVDLIVSGVHAFYAMVREHKYPVYDRRKFE